MRQETGHEDASRKVHLQLETGYRFRADFEGDLAPILLDEPPPLGEGSAPNASALLAAAVGNCLSASLLFCMRRARVDVDGMHAEVVVTPARNPEGRLRIGSVDVVLHPEVRGGSEGRLARCIDLFEDYCVVTDSVRHGIDVTVAVEPLAAGRSGDEPAGNG
jgi:organic hydroperoxide reductase OsmC/OhrA